MFSETWHAFIWKERCNNWRIFEQEYDIFIAAAYHDKPAKTRAIERERSFVYAAELHALGENGAVLTPAESREDSECMKMKFREICNPQQNKTMERHKFHSRNQEQGETIESFISDLRIKAKLWRIDRRDNLWQDIMWHQQWKLKENTVKGQRLISD